MMASFWHKQQNGWQRNSKRLAEGTDLDKMTPFNLLTQSKLTSHLVSSAQSSNSLYSFLNPRSKCMLLLPLNAYSTSSVSLSCQLPIAAGLVLLVYMALPEKISSLEAGLTANIFGSSIVSSTVEKKCIKS